VPAALAVADLARGGRRAAADLARARALGNLESAGVHLRGLPDGLRAVNLIIGRCRRPASNGLSETEERVAALAAQGRSNREIAAELAMRRDGRA
jgi:DNA-binding NarL/FixJ family response regulator